MIIFTRLTNSTSAVQVLVVVGLLAMVGGLLFPGTQASPSEADHQELLECKRKAEIGDIHSQHHLGFCDHHGRGVKSDLKETVKWYSRGSPPGFGASLPPKLQKSQMRGTGPELEINHCRDFHRA